MLFRSLKHGADPVPSGTHQARLGIRLHRPTNASTEDLKSYKSGSEDSQSPRYDIFDVHGLGLALFETRNCQPPSRDQQDTRGQRDRPARIGPINDLCALRAA
jgi:hypothetical protein